MPQPTSPPAMTRSSGTAGDTVIAVWVKRPVALRRSTATPATGAQPLAAIGRMNTLAPTTATISGRRNPP